MAVVGTLVTNVEARTGKFDAGMKRARGSLRGFEKESGRTTAALSGLASGFLRFIPALGSLGASAAVFKSVNLASELEGTRASLTALLGSAEKSGSLIKFIEEFSAKTPFAFGDILAGAQTSLVTGAKLKEIPTLMKRIGDVAAGSGSNVKDLALIYGQVRTAGRLMTQDMNQFSTRQIPIMDALNKQFGTTSPVLRKMVEEGKVSFADFEKAFASLTAKGGIFFNQMEVRSGTTGGKFSNLMDEMTFAATGFGEAIIEVFDIKSAVDAASGHVEGFKGLLANDAEVLKANKMFAAGESGIFMGWVLRLLGMGSEGLEKARAVRDRAIELKTVAENMPDRFRDPDTGKPISASRYRDIKTVDAITAKRDAAISGRAAGLADLRRSGGGPGGLNPLLGGAGLGFSILMGSAKPQKDFATILKEQQEAAAAADKARKLEDLRTGGGGPGGLNPLLGGAGLGFSIAMGLAKTGVNGKPAPQEFNKLAGAMEKGSVEAMQAIQRRKQMAGASKAVQEEQLDVQRKMLDALLNPGKSSDTEVDLTK